MALVKEMKAGNYSCHLSSSGEYLNHTLILVQLDPDNRTVILEEKSPEEGEIRKIKGWQGGNPMSGCKKTDKNGIGFC